MQLTTEEIAALKPLARSITAWIIDTGRAIRNGTADDRIAALDQSEELIDAIANYNSTFQDTETA